MSLAYNLNNTLNLACNNSIHPASANIARFYMNNPNAKEEEITEFAQTNNMSLEEVKINS